MNKSRRSNSGFSLVELLVVIGIIALLIAIMMPAMRIVRENNQRIQCQSNLRQIGFALLIYSNDNHGSMPSWSGWCASALSDNPGDDIPWTTKLTSIIKPDSAIYHCPSFPAYAQFPLHNYFIESEWAYVNGRHSTRYADIRMGGRFVISGDITQLALYPPPLGTSQETDDFDRDDGGMACICFPGPDGFLMHRGGNNILFDDNHVAVFIEFDPMRMTFHPKRMMSWDAVADGGADSP
jgi:prepilin-type N-terminal cleavage/methylation domain-containing protein